jgi:hypothetical protein
LALVDAVVDFLIAGKFSFQMAQELDELTAR